ncbi:type I polyketide synthase [Sorangium sp. So ce1099]|uniref:type I polyketide synthase n=1 Tax=Sorangium sp. So ce1099 TaxID=3133331 RepID=UPI003F61CD8E
MSHAEHAERTEDIETAHGDSDIAIVGMAGRFPGAPSVDALWQNVRRGVESIERFSEGEREDSPIGANAAPGAPIVCAGGLLADIECFDAAYFGISPREAQLMDPQQRLFLECAVWALEDAGCDPARFPGAIGVFGGCGSNTYLLQLLSHPDLVASVDPHALMLASEKDYLATRVSYKLNLHGPSVVVQTACSTSLVAVHMACESLLGGQCDLALAGGVSLGIPQKRGYPYVPGSICSPDGRCRPFDARAEGTVAGSGVGIVALKRLADALRDRNTIHAVIRGSAVNNDGGRKVGFTAPSVDGQAAAISEAQSVAGVDPGTIGYVEAHGTATALGDPIEVEALTQAFRHKATGTAYCALGSLKANIGHLDTAAGVAGLIKAAHVVRTGEIPPCVHFEAPNPKIDLAASPFFVPREAVSWPRELSPRRAGVSSFGIGGTNAHVVLEEPPPLPARAPAPERAHVLTLSARTPAALSEASARLAAYLEASEASELPLGDVAFTLQAGRAEHPYRRAVVARTRAEAVQGLAREAASAVARPMCRAVFAFPGQGAQAVGMGRELHEQEPEFRRAFDACAAAAARVSSLDLREIVFRRGEGDGHTLLSTALVQPALFAVELALARLWMSWGVEPAAMIGHSLGEIVAACIAGVFSLDDAMSLVIDRGRFMQATPGGSMLAVGLPRADVEGLLEAGLEVAAVNGPRLTVVAGAAGAIRDLAARLQQRDVFARPLQTSHAFHCALVDGALGPFREAMKRVRLSPPAIPVASNVTGALLTDAEATDPAYWVEHLRRPVRFSEGVETLFASGHALFLEVGPGRGLTTLVRQTLAGRGGAAIASLSSAQASSETASVAEALGQLWEAGHSIDWLAVRGGEAGALVRLPAYPFERAKHWIPARRGAPAPAEPAQALAPAAPTPNAVRTTAVSRARSGVAFVEPTTESERAIAAIWSALLGVHEIGIHDDFFGLHGDSLVATQVMSRIRAQLGVELPLRALFQGPTVAALAAQVDSALRGEGRQREFPPIQRIPRDGPLPLSFAQHRLWFVDQLEPGSPAYNVPFVVRAAGRLDIDALRRSLFEIARRHEALRTTFSARDGVPFPVIAPEARVPFRMSDLSHLAGEALDAAVSALVLEESLEPFDLSRGPLLRVRVIRRSHDEHIIVLVVHHVVFDVWSVGVFVGELAALYGGFAQGLPSRLPELPVQYVDFAAAQRAWLSGDVLEGELRYWKTKLAGAPPRARVPVDSEPAGPRTWRGARRSLDAGGDLTRQIKAFCEREAISPFMALLAAYKLVLHQRTGLEDLVVGTDVANRNRVETEPMIGFFVNQLVIRTDCAGDPAFGALVRRVRDVALEAFEHQDLPFDRLVEALRPKGAVGHVALFDAKFVMRNVHVPAMKLEGLELEALEGEAMTTAFDFVLTIAEVGDSFRFGVEYSSELYRSATVDNFLNDYRQILATAAARPEARISELRAELERAAAARRELERKSARGAALDRLTTARRRAVTLPRPGASGDVKTPSKDGLDE